MEYKQIIERRAFIPSSNQKRQDLLKFYKEIIVQYVGEKRIKEKKLEEWTCKEVFELLMGVYKVGLDINVPIDIKIGEISDPQKVSDETINKLIDNFKVVNDSLSEIIKEGDSYEFAYKTDTEDIYYWLDMADLMF